MTVTKEQNGNALTVFVEGKMDAVTSPRLEAELGDLAGVEELVFDLKDLIYTSSAGFPGLRRKCLEHAWSFVGQRGQPRLSPPALRSRQRARINACCEL